MEKQILKSFTLIELLVVIAIVGILSGLIFVSMNGAINSSKDARRKADIDTLRKALLYYKTMSGSYPTATCSVNSSCTALYSALVPGYVSALPLDPNGTYYSYTSASGTDFTVSATLSDSSTYSYNSSSGYGSSGGLSCPTDWIDSGHGFCVMQYEARNVSGTATSQTGGTIWTSVSQTAAASACSALGSGSHLMTNAEWTLLARDAEGVSSNWSGGSVGSGTLARGWAANTSYGDSWTNTALASTTGPSCLYNTGADTCGSTGTLLYRRTLTLANGNTIWDLSGNVWEWTNDTCTQGTGTGNWYNSGGWAEWTDSNLSDYEKSTAGPSGAYTSTNGAGRYYGCSVNGDAFAHGGYWGYGSGAGAFALNLDYAPAFTSTGIGFRCTR